MCSFYYTTLPIVIASPSQRKTTKKGDANVNIKPVVKLS